MAQKGRLRDFGLTQLLNLVHLARKTGGLSVSGARNTADFFFQEGKLVYATLADQPNTLAELMVTAGKLTRGQASALAASGRARDDKQLGLLMLNAGQVSRDEILQALRRSMLDVAYAVFQWDDGAFVFDQKVGPPTGRILIPVGLESLVLEGSRRRTEATDLHAELPSLDVVLKFTEGPGRNLRSINLSVDEWRVISFINPRNTIATIAQYNQMSELQVRRIVAKLLRDDLVEVVGGQSVARPAAPTPTAAKPAAKPSTPTARPAPTAPSAPDAPPFQPEPPHVKPTFTEPQVERNIIRRLIARIRGL